MVLSLQQAQFASAFPEVSWSPTDRVCIFRPEGVLTSDAIARLAAWLAEMESDLVQPFNRFTDLTQLQKTEIEMVDLANVAFWKRATYAGPPVKSALLAVSDETLTVANAYQNFMMGTPILVSVFQKVEDAASWLGVPLQSLAGEGVRDAARARMH
jgi:hypothetical protein